MNGVLTPAPTSLIFPEDVKPFLVMVSFSAGDDEEHWGKLMYPIYAVDKDAAMLTTCRMTLSAVLNDTGADIESIHIEVDAVFEGHPTRVWPTTQLSGGDEEDDGTPMQDGMYYPLNDSEFGT